MVVNSSMSTDGLWDFIVTFYNSPYSHKIIIVQVWQPSIPMIMSSSSNVSVRAQLSSRHNLSRGWILWQEQIKNNSSTICDPSSQKWKFSIDKTKNKSGIRAYYSSIRSSSTFKVKNLLICSTTNIYLWLYQLWDMPLKVHFVKRLIQFFSILSKITLNSQLSDKFTSITALGQILTWFSKNQSTAFNRSSSLRPNILIGVINAPKN